MAWQASTSPCLFMPNLKMLHQCVQKGIVLLKNQYVKKGVMLLPSINKLQWSCLHWYIVPGFTSVTLLFYHVHHPQGCTAQTLMGPPWGVVFFFQWGSCAQAEYPLVYSPIQKSIIESTSMVSPSMPGIICVGKICGGSNSVFSHWIPHKNVVHAWHDVKADA